MCNNFRLRLRLFHIGLGLPAAIFGPSAQLRTYTQLVLYHPLAPLNGSFSGFIRLFVCMHNHSVPPFEGINSLYCIRI